GCDLGVRVQTVPPPAGTGRCKGRSSQRGRATNGRDWTRPDGETFDSHLGRTEPGPGTETRLRDFREDPRTSEGRFDGPHGRAECIRGPTNRGFRLRHAERTSGAIRSDERPTRSRGTPAIPLRDELSRSVVRFINAYGGIASSASTSC